MDGRNPIADEAQVGGSTGFVCQAIARKFSELWFVVQDLPPVIEKAKREAPKDLDGRVAYMAHDFFQEQPVCDADVYIFRGIMYNWFTKYCLKILRNHIHALKPGVKVLVMDIVLPLHGTASEKEEERVRSMDLVMLELFNSHERELNDWKALFDLVDKRFVLRSVTLPEGSNKWLLVFEWNGS